MKWQQLIIAVIASVAVCSAAPAAAEANQLRIAQQFGVSYLPLLLIEHHKLVEKHAKAAGLGDIQVSWAKFAGGAQMNDAILSNSLDFASAGVAPAITLWAKSKGEVKLVTAMNSMPILLNSRNPKVKTIADFTEQDKIALPAVKVSIQAVTLQMAAEKVFGAGKHTQLDALTVTLAHPDAQIALLSGSSEINAHFSAPPFQYQQLEKPGIHTVLSSYDVLGGPATFNVVYASAKFRAENPKLYQSFLKAFEEATAIINRDKRAAAEFYLKVSKDKDSVENILKILNDPQIAFTQTPQNITQYSDFLFRIGSIKQKPDTWKDLFFPEIHQLPGS
jgi:NitT/TauT family transport system substrate-binding protein